MMVNRQLGANNYTVRILAPKIASNVQRVQTPESLRQVRRNPSTPACVGQDAVRRPRAPASQHAAQSAKNSCDFELFVCGYRSKLD
jgi:hypothetical protein